MKNKTIVIYSLIIAILAITYSCGEDWIETEPLGLVLEENYYETEEDAMAALTAAYDPLEWDYMSGMNGSYNPFFLIMNISTDDAVKGGDTETDQQNMEQFDNYNLNAHNEMVRGLWIRASRGIYRCNLVLENTNTEFLASATILAEARVLRAYYFFEAVRMWGDFPKLDHLLTTDEYYSTQRAPKREIFDLIVGDLQWAINAVNSKGEQALQRRAEVPGGRVTIGTAHALLGKVYLYMASPYYNYTDQNYYQLAANELASVYSSGDYAILDNYADANDPYLQNTAESVFEIQHSAKSEWSSWTNAAPGEGNFTATMSGVRASILLNHPIYSNGWSFNLPTQTNVNAYLAMGDSIRFKANILTSFPVDINGYTVPSDLGNAIDTVVPDVTTDMGVSFKMAYQHTGYYVKKYPIMLDLIPTSGDKFHNNPNNMVAIRYTDVLLMLAETMVNGATDPNGNSADFYVNLIRTRAKLNEITGVTMEDILAERRLELDHMGHRWFDLIRLNKAGEVLGPLGFTPGHEVFPVPQLEIDNTKGFLSQNVVYR